MNFYKDIPIIIICRDRLTPLKVMVNRLEDMGYQNLVFIDNESTYEPTVKYLSELQEKGEILIKSPNLGHRVLELSGIYTRYNEKPFVLTDCDCIPAKECPNNFLEHFYNIMQETKVAKVGFSLKIDDLPDSYNQKEEVIKWESQFRHPSKEFVYGWKAPIDTTFALCNISTTGSYQDNSVRCSEPYSCHHFTWYYDSKNLPEDEIYYRNHKLNEVGHWSSL